jgi:hypothetical protein
MGQNSADLFTRLAPVLNVRDVAAEREFYERLRLPVIYEGEEYPDFIAFGTDTLHAAGRYRLSLRSTSAVVCGLAAGPWSRWSRVGWTRVPR